jgi:hypothetical protein
VVPEAQLDYRELRRKARFFESEFGVRLRFGRIRRPHTAGSERARSANGAAGMRASAGALQRRSAA